MLSLAKRRPRLAGLLALILMLAVGAVAAAAFWPAPLPHPGVANQGQLIRWAVTRDLSDRPAEFRATLARRLAVEFDSGFDWGEAERRLQAEHREHLRRNIPLLVAPWLLTQSAVYTKSEPGHRQEVVDESIDLLERFRGAQRLLPASDAENGDANELLKDVLGRIELEKASLPPERREEAGAFITAIQKRWFWRSLTGQAR